MFKQNKWYNFGDVNPREHGGVFVKRVENEIEVVTTNIDLDNPELNYIIQSRSDYVDYLLARYESFKKNPEATTGDTAVGRFADWKRLIEQEESQTPETHKQWYNDLVFYLAVDMISYYGGDSEREYDTNYWVALGFHGITYRNYT